ncbi:glycosyltransferase [Butyricicoccus faecihominis]|uniref:glycosyltransferase n=1 Tax=Butyricicoccus faecihominis TaxID=1712515 RepID=UPI002478E32B|nr:glycosyltransferase [Butyricicoccus faecihominis]MCQ5131145.1 glycosyltransferase [Butyricicoccus faecihominis]
MKKIAILMAVYHPNRDWLREQLASLENQTWGELELWIADDGPDEPVGGRFFSDILKRIPFHYSVNDENFGADRSFADLVQRANGEYIAFCDQDDIWLPRKLEILANVLEQENAKAAYCALSAIDGTGCMMSDDIRSIQRGIYFLEGRDIAERLFVKNCIYGSALVMDAQTAKQALPIPREMPYDQWFSFWAAVQGKIAFWDEALVQHRLHGSNLSEPFKEITSRQAYYDKRIVPFKTRTKESLLRVQQDNSISVDRRKRIQAYLQRIYIWANARVRWYNKEKGGLQELWRTRACSPKVTWFEIALPFLPKKLVCFLLQKVLKNFV